MSAAHEIHRLINQIYVIEQILRSVRTDPKDYLGVSLYDNEAHTLKTIAENEGISQAQLTALMFRTKGPTSLVVDKLIEKGLVQRTRADDDRRRYLLSLTEQGRSANQAHISYDMEYAEQLALATGLDEHLLAQTNDVVAQLIGYYMDHRKGPVHNGSDSADQPQRQ